MNSKSVPDILFFWISIALISLTSGFIGGGLNPDMPARAVSNQQPQTIILEDRTRGEEPDRSELSGIISSHAKSIARVYHWQPRQNGMRYTDLPSDDNLVSYALVVTSDGWLVTSIPLENKPSSYTVLTEDGQSYPIQNVVSDTTAGYTFLHIAARNLRAIDFASFHDPIVPEDAYLLLNTYTIERITLTTPQDTPPKVAAGWIHHSNTLSKLHNPTERYQPLCMPVVRSERVVLGCTVEQGIRSFRYLQRSVSDLLRKGAIERHTLDIPYIDLSTIPYGLSDQQRTGARVTLEKGSLIRLMLADGSRLSLRDGDTILAVNNESVDQNRSLAELFGQYTRGDTVALRMVESRGGVKEFNLILN